MLSFFVFRCYWVTLCSRALTGSAKWGFIFVFCCCCLFALFFFIIFHFLSLEVTVICTMKWVQLCGFLALHARAVGFLLFFKIVILLSALPCVPLEETGTVAACYSHQPSNSAKHTELCCRPHHHTWQELLSWNSSHKSCIHSHFLSWLKDLGIARNVPKKPRRSNGGGGRRKQREISVTVGV